MVRIAPDKDLLEKVQKLEKFKLELYALMDKYGVSVHESYELDEFDEVCRQMYPMIEYHIFGESIREILNNKPCSAIAVEKQLPEKP